MTKRMIPVAAPVLDGNEKKYVLDCLDSTWISSGGEYVTRFEQSFAEYCGARHAASCCNGTVALHLALLAVGVGPGDEVILPTVTFIATANAVTYCGARPVLVDIEPGTWNIACGLIEAKITKHTKAIVVVHLYGHPADMDAILTVARRHNLAVIEDAAEAHGAKYKGRSVGSIGDIAIFSFYGNKIITTGEGGMVVTNNPDLAKQVRLLKGQGMDPDRRYWFPVVGYNYRMTNIAAAIGLAQLERIEYHLNHRRRLAAWYKAKLNGVLGITFQAVETYAEHSWWMFNIVLGTEMPLDRDEMMGLLKAQGIETRPIFYPMHVLPPYREENPSMRYPVADKISSRGLSLPTWTGVSEEDVSYITDCLIQASLRS